MGGGRTFFVLLVLLGAIALGIWWTQPEAGDEDGGAVRVLGGRHLLDAERIVVQHDPKLPKIELERHGDGALHLVEPIRDYASSAMLENIARVYDGAQSFPLYAADEVTAERLAELELEPGLGMIRVEWPEGEPVELRFGGTDVAGDAMFVLDGDEVRIVQVALRTALVANLADYRERFVFRTTRSQLQRIELRRRREDASVEMIELRRQGNGFTLVGRDDFDLNQGVVADVIDQVLALRVDRFVEGRRRPGPVEPGVVIVVDGMMGREQADLYVGDSGELFGWATPRELEFFSDPGQYGAVLAIPLQALRSNWLFDYLILEDLDGIVIARDTGRALSLERAGRDFRLTAPVDSGANPTPVAELLGGLRGFHVIDFVEDDAENLAPYGLDRGYLVLRLRGGVERDSVEIHVGSSDGERTFARRSDSNHVVAVSSEVAELLRRPWIVYADLRVTRLTNPAVVRRITVAQGPNRTEYVRTREGYWPDARVEDAFDVARDLVAKRALERAEVADLPKPVRVTLESDSELGTVFALDVYRLDDDRFVVGLGGREQVLYEVARRDGRALLELAPSR